MASQYRVLISRPAEKTLATTQARMRERILSAIRSLRADPRPRGCTKLTGTDDLWRIRVGDFRVIYTVRDEELEVLVVKVAQRKDAY
ncbi:MAG: type II toxin-antitoxin system RelE/ParE family toxin [Myxococcota bacterium]